MAVFFVNSQIHVDELQNSTYNTIMNEQHVFLKSEIGEAFLGTVDDIIASSPFIGIPSQVLMDIVSEVAFGDRIENSMDLTIELREPTGHNSGI